MKLYNKEVSYMDEHPRIVLSSLFKAVLGEGYYNSALDVYSSREEAVYDVLNKYNHKAAERYVTILRKNLRQYNRERKEEKQREEDALRIEKLKKELFEN